MPARHSPTRTGYRGTPTSVAGEEVTVAASAFVKDVDTAAFERDVVERSRQVPVVVDFWAAWCGPCRVLGPLLERLADEHGGAFELAKVDVDANQGLAARFGVQGIPTVVGFRGGEAVSRFTGALPEPSLRQWLEVVVPSEADRLSAAADAHLDEGEVEAAERDYREALALKPTHLGAGVGLATLLLGGDRPDEALEVLAALPQNAQVRRLQAAARLGRVRAGEVPELEAELAADPANAAVRIDLAMALAAAGSYAEALDHLLEVVRTGGEPREEARSAILDIFATLGDDHPLTGPYRRGLANALF